MKVIRDIEFVEPSELVDLGEVGSIRLSVRVNPRRSGLADVVVAFGEEEYTVSKIAEQRAEPHANGREGEIIPEIKIVAIGHPHPCIHLVGPEQIACVDLKTEEVRDVLHLNRPRDEYDPGFRREQIIDLEDGFLILYERGAARVRCDGAVVWHKPLFADDLLERRDEEYLYFSSEQEGVWTLSLEDGTKEALL